MTSEQARELIAKLDEALTLLREVKALLESGQLIITGEWHRDTVAPPYVLWHYCDYCCQDKLAISGNCASCGAPPL